MDTHEEHQYLNLNRTIIQKDTFETGRNGKIKSEFGNMMKFSLCDNTLPLLTTKKVAIKTCLKELLWFIHGKTDNRLLKKQNVQRIMKRNKSLNI